MLIAEMADYYDREKKDLVDVLEELYAKYGCYRSRTVSFEFKGKEGADKMEEILNRLRTEPPAMLGRRTGEQGLRLSQGRRGL